MLKFSRVFSDPKVHPYETVDWETCDIVQENWKTGEVIFRQEGVEFPKSWSMNARTIVATKYFRGNVGDPNRESSLKHLLDRVVDKYAEEAKDLSDDQVEVFSDELKYLLLHQYFSFNSPVWFNVGTEAPQQVSACFILSVDDSMDSILNWYREEGFVFKGGSGAGVNVSKIRGSHETLESGGIASGPISFMRGADASAGAIKSGGACLAPWSRVYTTEHGPKEVSELVDQEFTVISYDQSSRAMLACKATAFLSGYKQLVKLTTDKGSFTMSKDHPVLMMSGEYVEVGDLKPGMSIRPGTISINSHGYHRIGLYDGSKGKESIHRMVARDILQVDIEGMHVHHKDHNVANNAPSNLEVMTPSQHHTEHALECMENGTFALARFHGKGNHPQIAGDNNGLSNASGNRDEKWKKNWYAGMRRVNAWSNAQKYAAHQRVLNTAYKVVNSGGSIDTFDEYIEGRSKYVGKLGYSKAKILKKIESRFGSYDKFIEEVRANNHKVESIEYMDDSPVYDVQVFNDTPDDRSFNDAHNFLLCSDENDREKSITGIMVHNTRRSAKMVVMDVDHPDIEEFVQLKSREEEKIKLLRDAGYDMELGGVDSHSVQYQNANNSVRVSDEFMTAVQGGKEFSLINRVDGEVHRSVSAIDLFNDIAYAAWSCADPGIQYHDTINKWHTIPKRGPIEASNPCSEYMSISNSSCNLASLNLMKFLRDDGSFDIASFTHVVELVITAMDISISFADFPVKEIGENTRAFRQLGLGYANLGALLMALGYGYDSDEGRAIAGNITALMTGAAYAQSARLASVMGPYHGYKSNKDAHLKVMEMHESALRTSVSAIGTRGNVSEMIHNAASDAWHQALSIGKEHGYRNSQASVLAPTGTIGFMMDCDTTGIEPDFSLVKFKKLVGGGSMQIVNNTVARALDALGYNEDDAKAIIDYICEHGHVVDAPKLKPNHHGVFDTAVGERSISPMGHLRMMAACQPFLSGAISKTINMPEDATVEDIGRIYMRGWELGLKAVAVYRDNCKVGQPLSSKKEDVEEEVVQVEQAPSVRKSLPRSRPSSTTSFKVGGAEGYLTSGQYEDGQIGEIFMKLGKQGSTMAGIMDAFSIAVSIGLQYGVPLEVFVEKFINVNFEPAGMTDDQDIRMSKSIVDYTFRRLALDYLPFEEREAMGIYSASERERYVNTGYYQGEDVESEVEEVKVSKVVRSSSELMSSLIGKELDAPMCFTCGVKMRPSGSCYICEGCGSTSGCS